MNIGDKIKSKNYGYFTVEKRLGGNRVLCVFDDTGYKTTAQWTNALKGAVMDRLMPVVYGVGFVGGTEFKTRHNGVNNRAYDAWRNMLRRCYDADLLSKRPSYIGCTVCDEWHNFQNFAKWFDSLYSDGMEIDKDIKVDGNKVYGPDYCIFVSPQENSQKANAKSYMFTSPSGENFKVYNLSKFCRENSLLNSKMGLVHSGKRRHHAGWTKCTI